MKYFATFTLIVFVVLPRVSQAHTTHTGTVERVWEDGFRLQTSGHTLWVDASGLRGENLPKNIAIGDRVSVTGRLGRIEFDASSITDATASR